MSLDQSRLIGLKILSNKRVAQCPACALNGGDKNKNHLVIYPDGKYGCVVDKSEEHSKIIWKLAAGQSVDYIAPETTSIKKIEVERTWPINKLESLVRDHSYWNKRGISDETVAPFRGGVAVTVGQMQGRYVFPMFKNENTIIGFTGRRIDGKSDMKWKHLGKTSLWKWGDINEIKKTKRAILVESIGDALKLMEYGVKDVLCIFGLNLSETVLGLLISLSPNEIIISTNRDNSEKEQGQKAAIRIKKTLDTFFNPSTINIIHPPENRKDWGEATKEEITKAFSHEFTGNTNNG